MKKEEKTTCLPDIDKKKGKKGGSGRVVHRETKKSGKAQGGEKDNPGVADVGPTKFCGVEKS